MSNKLFVDSSLLIEYRKVANTQLLDNLLANESYQLCISQVVVSEYLFHHLGIFGGKAPRTICENKNIAHVIQQKDPKRFLELFLWLEDNVALLDSSIMLMETYNLLPNDALILSICKYYNIKILASFDPDFIDPCKKENILLLQTAKDFEQLLVS